MNFYPFHIGDYISHTHYLTDQEDLAYRRMMDLYYLNEQPFCDSADVAKKVKTEISIVEGLLKEFFELKSDGCWHNKRADLEIAKYQLFKDAGKKGAEKRWGNREEKLPQSDPISPPNATSITTKTITNTITNTKVNTIPTPAGVSDDLWNDFLIYRKRLKAPVSDRVLARLIKEAELAKMPLDQVLETIIFKGWRSFEASWIHQEAKRTKELPLGTNEQIEQAYRVECGKDPAQARFNSYFDMRNYIIKFREQKATA